MIGQADLAETVARVGATYKSGDGVLQNARGGLGLCPRRVVLSVI